MLQDPVLHQAAAIRKHDAVIGILDGGESLGRGGDGGSGRCRFCLACFCGRSGCRRWFGSRLRFAGRWLRLGLRCGLRRGGLGLDEILESEEDDDREKAENQERSHVAAATAAGSAASLHLKIWILIFGQRKLPVLIEQRETTATRFYGKGSWETWREMGAGGTWSRPPLLKGWQRNRRQRARQDPRRGPWVAMATAA